MRRLAAVGALLALAACGEGGDPVQMALRDAAAARQAAAVKEGVSSAPAAAGDPATPAAGDAAFVARMIEHHEAALALARETLDQSGDPEIRRMAEAEIETRSREIARLKAWTPAAPAAR